jgi:hypothetical protein
MADEQEPTQPPPPPPVDEGLAAWATLVEDLIRPQSGVEIVGHAGGSVSFRFRGQTFVVTVQRTS